MNFEQRIAAAFHMTDAVWQRHANPWSVWTRVGTLPFLALAIWSRLWLGWFALAPIGLLMLWIWLNPRLFARPRSTDNWASKAVLGERVWLARNDVAVPRHHRLAPHVLSGIAGLGLPPLAYGLIVYDVWAVVAGCALVYLGKMWFLDRMVWLYEDMKDATPEYRAWLYGETVEGE